MNAKIDEAASIQEIYDVATLTKDEVEAIGLTKEHFLDPKSPAVSLIAEGIINRVFRITEEVGHLSSETAEQYGFERQGAAGVRNRLAHAYGEVDREIIWDIVENELEDLIAECRAYCDDKGYWLK